MHGPCPTTTAYEMNMWRKNAIERFRNDNYFHMKVETIVAHVMDAASEFYMKETT
jgi:hypothetical protein